VKAGFAARRLAGIGVPMVQRLPKFIAEINVPINPLYDLMLTARKP
jgi:hypothetical protein